MSPDFLAQARKLFLAGSKDLDLRIEALVAKYVAAEARVERIVQAALLAGRLGEAKYRNQRRAEVARLMLQLDRATAAPAKETVADAYRLGSRVAQKGGVVTPSSFSRVNKEAVSLLLDSLSGRLDAATATVGRQVDDIFRREGLRIAAAQIVDERPLSMASDALVKRLTKQGASGFTDAAGRQWQLSTYAEMAVRTVTAEAVTTATETTMLARGFDLVAIEGPVDKDTDDLCLEFVGRTFSLTGRTKGYPILTIRPPFHPNCRHFMVPDPAGVTARLEELNAA